MKKSIFNLKTITVLTMLVLTSTFIITGCSSKTVVANEEKVTSVRTEKVTKGSIEKTETYAGYLKPIKEVDVSSKSMGFVDQIYYDVGDAVRQGDILFVMDKRNARNNLVVLESQMDTQASQLEATLKSTQLQYNDSKKRLEDMTVLLSEGIISEQQLVDTRTAYDQSKIAYETAQESYNLFFNNAKGSSFSAQIDIARENLMDHEVNSPINGVVAERTIEIGELVGAQPAFKIVQLDKLILEVNLPESVLSNITLGNEIDISVGRQTGEPIKGKVVEISPSADKRTFTYPVKIEIDNASGTLRDGMYAEASFVTENNDNALLINRKAILLDNSQKYIFVIQDQRALRVNIDVGVDNGTKLEILDGLTEGQVVIVKGQEYLNDGDRVKVVK